MSTQSSIEWTDITWNPTTGCDRISPGCERCYALTMAKRLKGMGQAKYQNDGDPKTSGPGFGIATHAEAIMEPLRWRRPRRVFVNSMSDLFHAGIQTVDLHLIFGVMAATPQHTYQILTKRHGRMRSLLNDPQFAHMTFHRAKMYGRPDTAAQTWPLPNVWLGASVEDQKHADLRVPALLDTPAAVRFLSCEPLLGPVDLTRIAAGSKQQPDMVFDALNQRYGVPGRWQADSSARVDWVITGGESGPGARPMHPDWVRVLRDQCTAARVPFLFKQWGAWAPSGYVVIRSRPDPGSVLVEDPVDEHGHRVEMRRVGKKAAGRELDGRTWDEFPATAVGGMA